VLLTDEASGIVNDPVLLRIADNRFWLACADNDVLLWAKGVARKADVDAKLPEGIPVIVACTGWTGELGYEIHLLDPAKGIELWNRLMEGGKPFGLMPAGPSDIRRVKAGMLNYGIDMTLDNNRSGEEPREVVATLLRPAACARR
jgi:aminomethyltransferase